MAVSVWTGTTSGQPLAVERNTPDAALGNAACGVVGDCRNG
jgi:hypothetical protein